MLWVTYRKIPKSSFFYKLKEKLIQTVTTYTRTIRKRNETFTRLFIEEARSTKYFWFHGFEGTDVNWRDGLIGRSDPSPGEEGAILVWQSPFPSAEVWPETAGIRAVNIVWWEWQGANDSRNSILESAEVFRRNVTTTKRGKHACHLGNITRGPINGRLYGGGNLWDESRAGLSNREGKLSSSFKLFLDAYWLANPSYVDRTRDLYLKNFERFEEELNEFSN